MNKEAARQRIAQEFKDINRNPMANIGLVLDYQMKTMFLNGDVQ